MIPIIAKSFGELKNMKTTSVLDYTLKNFVKFYGLPPSRTIPIDKLLKKLIVKEAKRKSERMMDPRLKQ